MNNKYKLLVVEDEANIRSFMETILDTNGYKVMTAENCEQGIFMFSYYSGFRIARQGRVGVYKSSQTV